MKRTAIIIIFLLCTLFCNGALVESNRDPRFGKPTEGDIIIGTAADRWGITAADTLFLQLDQTTPQTIANGIPLMTTAVDGEGPGSQLINKDYVDLAVSSLELSEFFHNDPDALGGLYFLMDETEDTGGSIVSSGVPSGAAVNIFNFLTPDGKPGLDRLVEGFYDCHVHISRSTSITRDVTVHFELYKRASIGTGGAETLLGVSEIQAITTTSTEYTIHLTLAAEEVILTTDRLLIKWLATVTGAGGVNPTVTMDTGGIENSHFSVRVNALGLATVYVPQSLATAENDFIVASGPGVFAKKTLAETAAILESMLDHDLLQDGHQDVKTTASPTWENATLDSAIPVLTFIGPGGPSDRIGRITGPEGSNNFIFFSNNGYDFFVNGNIQWSKGAGDANPFNYHGNRITEISKVEADDIDIFSETPVQRIGADATNHLALTTNVGERRSFITYKAPADSDLAHYFSCNIDTSSTGDKIFEFRVNSIVIAELSALLGWDLFALAFITTGTLDAGAITGTSFTIGGATLDTTDWAILDTLGTMPTGTAGALALLKQVEVELLDDATAGTAVAGKVLAVGSGLNLNMGFGDRTNPGDIDGGVNPAKITDIDASPHAHWQFEDENGDFTLEAAEGGATLVLTAGTTIPCDRGSRLEGTKVIASKGLECDGSSYWTPTGYEGVTGVSGRSLSVWVKTDTDAANKTILKMGAVTGVQLWDIRLDTDKALHVFFGEGNANSAANLGIEDGQWHHVVITNPADGDGSGGSGEAQFRDIKMYLDGVDLDIANTGDFTNGTTEIDTTAGNDILIGSSVGGTSFWLGCIDEFTLLDFELTQSQVTAVFQGQRTRYIGDSSNTSIDWTNSDTLINTSKSITGGSLHAGNGFSGSWENFEGSFVTVVNGIIISVE